MSKIGDLFKQNTCTKKPIINVSSGEKQVVIDTTDQFKSGDASFDQIGKDLMKVIVEGKKEVTDVAKELIKDHPDLSLFITAMCAGCIMGQLENKKEMDGYLKDLQKFSKKVERMEHYKEVAHTFTLQAAVPGFLMAVAGLATLLGPARDPEPLYPAGPIGVGAIAAEGAVVVTSIISSLLKKEMVASKDGRFVMTAPHKFVTVPPEGDKLIFYSVAKRGKKYNIIPEKTIILEKKADHLSMNKDKKCVYIHYNKNGSGENQLNDIRFIHGKTEKDMQSEEDCEYYGH